MQDGFLVQLVPKKTEFQIDEVAIVGSEWFKAESAPSAYDASKYEPTKWRLGPRTVTCKNLCHEYALALLKMVVHASGDPKVLLAKCKTIVYFLMPHVKLLSSSVFLLTEEGVSQLLAYHLACLFLRLALKSEKRQSTGHAMQGMLAYAYQQFSSLLKIEASFVDLQKLQQSTLALLLLYADPKDTDQRVAVRLAAMSLFLKLEDRKHYEAAQRDVPPHTGITPSTKFEMPELTLPSSLGESLSFEPLSKLCLQLAPPAQPG